jgi:hypothetical protein
LHKGAVGPIVAITGPLPAIATFPEDT